MFSTLLCLHGALESHEDTHSQSETDALLPASEKEKQPRTRSFTEWRQLLTSDGTWHACLIVLFLCGTSPVLGTSSMLGTNYEGRANDESISIFGELDRIGAGTIFLCVLPLLSSLAFTLVKDWCQIHVKTCAPEHLALNRVVQTSVQIKCTCYTFELWSLGLIKKCKMSVKFTPI